MENGKELRTIWLAGGCFWGVQAYFDQFDGVEETQVGYANGDDDAARTAAPSYQDVCGGSGHAETLKITYDPARLPLEKLLALYFDVIDPVSVNRQGHDAGVQYRTGIYWEEPADPEDLAVIRRVCAGVEERIGRPIAVERKALAAFWPAEEYHQKYLDKNPGGYCHIPREKLGR